MSTHSSAIAGVLFAMRYPDNIGYVWDTVARLRDTASGNLDGRARCFVAYPELTGQPSYAWRHAQSVALSLYDQSPAEAEKISAFIRKNNIKVVVFMSALPSMVNLKLLRSLGVRTMTTENDSFDHIQPDSAPVQLAKWVLRSVLGRQSHDLHLANSRAQYAFQRTHAKLPPRKLVLMENSVDCNRNSPGDQAQARAATGLEADWTWIVCVSQARPEKRLSELVRIAHEVFQARPAQKIGFVYVGDGATVPAAKALAQELGVTDRFRFAGRQTELAPYYRAADFMVHAASIESFGLAIVEAMACARPVVACAAVGPSETIKHGETGMLVDLHDLSKLRDAILTYVDDPALVRKHGAAARKHAEAKYSMERQARQFADCIARFL